LIFGNILSIFSNIVSYFLPTAPERCSAARNGPRETPDAAMVGMANRGDELVHVSAGKDESPLDVSWMLSAKRNRDRRMRDGVRCEPLPVLMAD
jgi:hypothetical protein